MSVWGSKHNALLYSRSNDLQVQYGKKLAYTAGIKPGQKILDMGCGTGELTAFLAGLIGKQGLIVGVDPDHERIKLAIQKCSAGIHDNITFVNGDSSDKFPHRGEQYFDLHFSNFVIQWLNTHEKKTFIDTAFKSLKPGGKIAIVSHEKNHAKMSEVARLFVNDDNEPSETVQSYLLKKSEIKTLLEKAGFTVVHSEYLQIPYTFSNVQDFLTFLCASDYYDDKKISQGNKGNILKQVVNQDGTVTVSEPTIYQ